MELRRRPAGTPVLPILVSGRAVLKPAVPDCDDVRNSMLRRKQRGTQNRRPKKDGRHCAGHPYDHQQTSC
jgi:hypothetical protein